MEAPLAPFRKNNMCNLEYRCTGRMGWMTHRKWKESKQQPSILPGSAVSGCYLVSFHFLWAIHPIRPLDHLPVEKILFRNFLTFSPFILGAPISYYPRDREEGTGPVAEKLEKGNPQKQMTHFVSAFYNTPYCILLRNPKSKR